MVTRAITRIQFAFVRKQPQQRRSREMVERIIAAGREVLLRDGYDAFSTNRIAAQAGISPGSLYQYFPNKDEIIDAVVQRYGDDLAEKVAAALGDRIGDAGPGMIRDTADALLTALEADVGLLRVSVEELPASRHRARRSALEKRVRELCVAYLAARPDLLRSADHATSAWMLVLSVEALTVRYVLDAPDIDRDVFLDEVTALCQGYLAR
jgi:AcrR family transcriptional regulator